MPPPDPHLDGAAPGHGGPTRRRRLLIPREHGAYGQLLVPLGAALVVVGMREAPEPEAGSRAAAILVALASLLLFAAHESLLVLLGQRGARALVTDGARARRTFAVLAAAAAALGLSGTLLAPRTAQLGVLIAAALGAATAAAALRRAIKSLAGELLAAAALSSTALPVVTAAGHRFTDGLAVWLPLLAGFIDATLVVRALVGRLGTLPVRTAVRVAAAVVLGSLLVEVALIAPGAPLLAAACAPVALATLGVALASPHPRHLRRVGWLTAFATVVSATLIVAALH